MEPIWNWTSMERIDELPLIVLVELLNYAYENISANLLTKGKTDIDLRTLQCLASVSRSWANGMAMVVANHRAMSVSFTFRSVPGENASEFDTGTAAQTIVRGQYDTIQKNNVSTSSSALMQYLHYMVHTLRCKVSQPRYLREEEKAEGTQESVGIQKSNIQQKSEREDLQLLLEAEITQLLEVLRTKNDLQLRELKLSDNAWRTRQISDDVDQAALVDCLQWSSVFNHCRRLQRLDLSQFPLESPLLPGILIAASTHCKQLRVLVLPQQDCLGYQRRDLNAVFEAIKIALQNWSLQRLIMPKLYAHEHANEFMHLVAKHCPAIEYIEGLRLAPVIQSRRLTSEQVLALWMDAWTAFCASCSQLSEWNWFYMPFIDAFFAVFAANPKKHIQILTLPGNTALWKRDYLLEEHREGQPVSFTCTISGVTSVLYACRNLKELNVLFSDRLGNDTHLVFGDEFLRQVAVACPNLERLVLAEASERHGFDQTNNFGDEGISAIACLEKLYSVELGGVDCSAKALLALIAHRRSRNEPHRRVQVTLGGRGTKKVNVPTKFNQLLLNLVQLLTTDYEVRNLPCFSLQLHIETSTHHLPIMWEQQFVRKWISAKQELEQKLPQLEFTYDLVNATAVIKSCNCKLTLRRDVN